MNQSPMLHHLDNNNKYMGGFMAQHTNSQLSSSQPNLCLIGSNGMFFLFLMRITKKILSCNWRRQILNP